MFGASGFNRRQMLFKQSDGLGSGLRMLGFFWPQEPHPSDAQVANPTNFGGGGPIWVFFFGLSTQGCRNLTKTLNCRIPTKILQLKPLKPVKIQRSEAYA